MALKGGPKPASGLHRAPGYAAGSGSRRRLRSKRASVVPECRAEMDRAHIAWKSERDRICSEETEEDKGGSMYPMLLSSCKTTATKARILLVKDMGACPGER